MVRIVHIVGTGTIGEPLIGLMADNREAFGIDEVTFHKRTPLLRERGKVNDLVSRGAHLSVDRIAGPASKNWVMLPSWRPGKPSSGPR